MKNTFKLLYAFCFSFILFSCDPEQRDQDVSPLGSNENKPVASVSSEQSSDSEVTEGEIVTFAVDFDKPFNRNITFDAVLVDGDASTEDIVLGSSTIGAYNTSTQIEVEFVSDGVPEDNENITLAIVPSGDINDILVQNDTENITFNYSILDDTVENGVQMSLSWETEDDLDLLVTLEGLGSVDFAATSNNPETGNLIVDNYPDGTYVIGIDPYEVAEGNDQIPYELRFGTADGSVTVFEHVFDYENRDEVYETTYFDAWGIDIYVLAYVEKNGSTYTFTDAVQ